MATKLNLLVVDDEQIVLDSIRKHFRSDDSFEVMTALSAMDAISQMEGVKVHIILTDMMMPEIDGLEFIRMVKKANPGIIMIMITGYATINTALQSMQLGAFDYLAKPFTREELKKVVKRAADIISASEGAGLDNITHLEIEDPDGKGFKGVGKNTWMMVLDEGNVQIGVERPFLINMGQIQSVYLPSVGDELRQGSVCFQAFSGDFRSQSLYSPISGVVVEINEYVNREPDKALQDPYKDGWLFKIKPSKFEEEIKVIGL
jgi:CheY-like chemotaxis protein/glycine cleavage system H lipoate-binding protein